MENYEEKNYPTGQEAVPPIQNGEENPTDIVMQKRRNIVSYLHDMVISPAGVLFVFLLLLRLVVVPVPSSNNNSLDAAYLLLFNNVSYFTPT